MHLHRILNIDENEIMFITRLHQSIYQSYIVIGIKSLQALKFFDQRIKPKTCTCGLVVAFNVASVIDCVKDVIGNECVEGITQNAIRMYVKSNGIGCTGKQVKFRMLLPRQQVRAVHMKREWFAEQTLVDLDRSK